MKYILMMNTPERGPYSIFNWPKKDFEDWPQIMALYSLLKRMSDRRCRPPGWRREDCVVLLAKAACCRHSCRAVT